MRAVPKNGDVESWVLGWGGPALLSGCSQERKQPQGKQGDGDSRRNPSGEVPLSLAQLGAHPCCWKAPSGVLRGLLRVELKPTAMPTFPGQGADNFYSVWFSRAWEMLLARLAGVIQQIPVVKEGGIFLLPFHERRGQPGLCSQGTSERKEETASMASEET